MGVYDEPSMRNWFFVEISLDIPEIFEEIRCQFHFQHIFPSDCATMPDYTPYPATGECLLPRKQKKVIVHGSFPTGFPSSPCSCFLIPKSIIQMAKPLICRSTCPTSLNSQTYIGCTEKEVTTCFLDCEHYGINVGRLRDKEDFVDDY